MRSGHKERSTSDHQKSSRGRSPQNLTALGATRFDLKYGMGGLSDQALMNNIELYGTQVIPRVRELMA
jgi:hypothetical protein